MADAFGGERPEAGRPIWKVLQQPQEKMGGPWLGMADGFCDRDCQPWRNQCMVQEPGRRVLGMA